MNTAKFRNRNSKHTHARTGQRPDEYNMNTHEPHSKKYISTTAYTIYSTI